MIRLFWDGEVAPGEMLVTGAPARHARVRRVNAGDPIRLVDGRGHVASGQVASLEKHALVVLVEGVIEVPRPVALDVLVPVADRDRMLLAAEKCVELQATSWRPAYFARSRSVSPRGEGTKFREKVAARMQSALEQCGAAWMPEIHDELESVDAFQRIPADRKKFLLDVSGRPLVHLATDGAVAIAIGPEGGIEDREAAAAREYAWTTASLSATILRFETAIIAAAAVIRATQHSRGSL